MSPCPWSYGIVVDEPFTDTVHPTAHVIKDKSTSFKLVKDQLTWLIRKNDLILSKEPLEAVYRFKQAFRANQPKGVIRIYRCDRDDPPLRLGNGMNASPFIC